MALSLSLLELPPEILHTACSFLDEKDARILRLTCKRIGVVADCYAFQRLVFYLHAGDFDMLRYFASHDVFSKNVKSLIYTTDLLPERRLSLRKFVARLQLDDRWYKTVYSRGSQETKGTRPLERPQQTGDSVKKAYDKYVEVHQRQSEILANGEDFAVLKDVVPKFTGLREIIVSSRNYFREFTWVRTPFDALCLRANDELEPQACRHIGSLLLPLVGLGPKIQSLCLTQVDWSFARQLEDPSRLTQMVEICRNITRFHINMDTGCSMSDEGGMFVAECRDTIRKGHLRLLLEAMPNLESLGVVFSYMNEATGLYPAQLKDLVSETTHWPHLMDVKFDVLEASRQDLICFISLHSSTLRTIELRDVRLIKSSWRIFLPQLQELAEEMFLDDILLAGHVQGESEEDIPTERREERFDFGDPDDAESECLSDDITDYILWANGPNPLNSFP